jgi:hypothetical protein
MTLTNTLIHTHNQPQPDASALEDAMGAQAALADSTVEGLYTNAVIAEPDGPGPTVCLAPGFEVRSCVRFAVLSG